MLCIFFLYVLLSSLSVAMNGIDLIAYFTYCTFYVCVCVFVEIWIKFTIWPWWFLSDFYNDKKEHYLFLTKLIWFFFLPFVLRLSIIVCILNIVKSWLKNSYGNLLIFDWKLLSNQKKKKKFFHLNLDLNFNATHTQSFDN